MNLSVTRVLLQSGPHTLPVTHGLTSCEGHICACAVFFSKKCRNTPTSFGKESSVGKCAEVSCFQTLTNVIFESDVISEYELMHSSL